MHVFTRCTCRFAAPLYTNMCSFCVILSLPRWFFSQFAFRTLFVVQVHTGSRCLPKTSLVMEIHNDLTEVPEKKTGSHFCFAIGLEGVSPYIFVSFSCFLFGSAEDIHGDASTGNVAWTPPQAMSNHWVRIGVQEIQKCAAPEPG